MPSIAEHIATKIKELRVAAGLTQTALAEQLKVTPNTVSRWESGVYEPRLEDLERIARALAQPIWALLPTDVQPPERQLQALLSATGDLPPEDIEELIRYADFVRARHALKKPRKRRGQG